MTEILKNEAVTISYEASNLGTGQRIELIKTWAVQFSREELIVLLGMFSSFFVQDYKFADIEVTVGRVGSG
jgi:hypothetical protein